MTLAILAMSNPIKINNLPIWRISLKSISCPVKHPEPVGIVLNYWPRHKTTGPGIHWWLVKWPTPHWLFAFSMASDQRNRWNRQEGRCWDVGFGSFASLFPRFLDNYATILLNLRIPEPANIEFYGNVYLTRVPFLRLFYDVTMTFLQHKIGTHRDDPHASS